MASMLEMQLSQVQPAQVVAGAAQQQSNAAAPATQGGMMPAAFDIVLVLAVFFAIVYGLHLVERVAKKGR